MQHMRLLFAKGLFPPTALCFCMGHGLCISAALVSFFKPEHAEAIYEVVREPVYFLRAAACFPVAGVASAVALTLLATTAVILFLPKLLSVLVIIVKGGARAFAVCCAAAERAGRSCLFHAVCANPDAVSQ